jgi:outer membrane receptor protein involved in Fe transport
MERPRCFSSISFQLLQSYNNPSRVRANFNYTNNTRDYILANPSAKFKVNLLSLYVQDEIQVTDNFKLTAGIRFDYAGVPDKQPLSTKTSGAAG